MGFYTQGNKNLVSLAERHRQQKQQDAERAYQLELKRQQAAARRAEKNASKGFLSKIKDKWSDSGFLGKAAMVAGGAAVAPMAASGASLYALGRAKQEVMKDPTLRTALEGAQLAGAAATSPAMAGAAMGSGDPAQKTPDYGAQADAKWKEGDLSGSFYSASQAPSGSFQSPSASRYATPDYDDDYYMNLGVPPKGY